MQQESKRKDGQNASADLSVDGDAKDEFAFMSLLY